ncbi:hypothetical protein FACS1894204_13320 [Synergistales bacterium]|nr:hypothetical protein FACS1894204_13320 [Synergistales bacterium]
MNITVIVPVYNAALFLEETLGALLSQNFSDYEIVCIDDGSTDASPEILRRYATEHSAKLRVLTKENGGVHAARLCGIGAAHGEYITFCDADDIPACNWLSEMYVKITNDNADLCVCAFRRVLNGKPSPAEMCLSGSVDTTANPEVFILINTCLWNKLFKASLFMDALPESAIRVSEDALFLAWLYRNVKRISFVSEPLYDYRVYETSAIANVTYEDFLAAANALCDMSRCEKLAMLNGFAFVQLGIIFPLLTGSVRVYREAKLLLDKNFPGWRNCVTLKILRKSPYKSNLLKIYVALMCYRLRLFPLLIGVYNFAVKRLRVNIKW